ncbi:MAG: MerR family transcriptional regulator [Paracoccaceae bacterium]
MSSKSPDAFRTISEVAEWLDTPAHVLRFWESKFTQVKPVKRAGGRRYYRPADMELIGGIKKLLHDEGMTIKGVQKILREQGVRYVAGLSQPIDGTVLETEPEPRPEATVLPFGRPGAEATPDASAPAAGQDSELPGFLRGAPPRPVPEAVEVVLKDSPPEAADMPQGPASEAPDSISETPPAEPEHHAPEKPGAEPVSGGQSVQAEPDQPAAPPARVPRILDLPPDPADDDPAVTASPGLLSRLLSRTQGSAPLPADQARELARELAALRTHVARLAAPHGK